MVISHPRELLATHLVNAMINALEGKGSDGPQQLILPLQVFTPENI